MGGSSPPVKATFTLKPTPAPLPTWKAEKHSLLWASVCRRMGRQTDKTERELRSPHQGLRCRERSFRRHSDAEIGRGHWGPRRKPAGCRCHDEHPGDEISISIKA